MSGLCKAQAWLYVQEETFPLVIVLHIRHLSNQGKDLKPFLEEETTSEASHFQEDFHDREPEGCPKQSGAL